MTENIQEGSSQSSIAEAATVKPASFASKAFAFAGGAICATAAFKVAQTIGLDGHAGAEIVKYASSGFLGLMGGIGSLVLAEAAQGNLDPEL